MDHPVHHISSQIAFVEIHVRMYMDVYDNLGFDDAYGH